MSSRERELEREESVPERARGRELPDGEYAAADFCTYAEMRASVEALLGRPPVSGGDHDGGGGHKEAQESAHRRCEATFQPRLRFFPISAPRYAVLCLN